MKFNMRRIGGIIIIFFLGLTIWHLLALNKIAKTNNLFLKKEIIGLEKKVKDVYAEKKSLKSEISAFKKEKELLVAKINQYENEAKGLTDEIGNLRNNLMVLDESISAKDAELNLLRIKIEEYETTNTALRRSIISFDEVAKPRSGAIELAPITVKSKGEKAKEEVEVLGVNKDYGFIVINAGKNQGITEGDLFFVYRGEKMLGRIEVEKTANDVSIARALYKSLRDIVKKGDRISH